MIITNDMNNTNTQKFEIIKENQRYVFGKIGVMYHVKIFENENLVCELLMGSNDKFNEVFKKLTQSEVIQ